MNFYILIFLTAFFSSMLILNIVKVYGQADQGPLRYKPNINEDQIIICVKDVKHEKYYGQLSCIINNDGLDNPLLKKLGNQAMSLKNTFEMGLID